jgi:hypothetical protein
MTLVSFQRYKTKCCRTLSEAKVTDISTANNFLAMSGTEDKIPQQRSAAP